MISIIVPLYNLANYCEPCLDSLRKQTYSDIEIILVNDGSTDGTSAICHGYEKIDPRFRVIDQENGGVSVARNTGLQAARGEYIMFADGDDIVSPDYVEHILSKMGDNVVFSACAFERITDCEHPVFTRETAFVENSALESLERLLQGRFPVSVCGGIFRVDVAKTCSFPVGITDNEDKYFIFQYLLKTVGGSVVRSDAVLYDYLVRENSATTSAYKGSTDVIIIADRMLADVRENIPSLEDAAVRASISARLQTLHGIVGSGQSRRQYKKLYQQIKKETLQMSKDRKLSKQATFEVAVLKTGNLPYRMLVRLYYGIASNRLRYSRNAKRMTIE